MEGGGGGGGACALLNWLYGYVPPLRVWFSVQTWSEKGSTFGLGSFKNDAVFSKSVWTMKGFRSVLRDCLFAQISE